MITVVRLFALIAVFASALAQAQTWPSKPVRLVIGYASGSGADIEARVLAPFLEQAWKTPVIVDTRPGAGSMIGADLVAKSAPDGYTFFLSTAGVTTFASLVKAVPFDVMRDFEAVSLMNDTAPLLVVNSAVPARTLGEFVAWAKANAGKVNYGSAGRNSIVLMIESLKLASGIQMTEVPYAGQGAYLTALIRNDVQLVMAAASAARPLIEAGSARAIAAFGGQRAPNFPEIATVGEQGFPTLRGGGWYGILAPRGTPRDIIEKFAAEIPRFAATPAQRERATRGGFVWIASTPAQFRERLQGELNFWADIARQIGMTPE